MSLREEAYRLDPQAGKRPVIHNFMELVEWVSNNKTGSTDPLIMSPEFAVGWPALVASVEERQDSEP